MPDRKLGRKPHEPAAVAAAPRLPDHLKYTTEGPLPRLDRSAVNYRPIMAGNGALPDCTVAGLLNGASAIEALNTGGPLAIKDGCWLPFYAALAHCPPTVDAIAATDGLVMLDVLRAQGRAGFDIGQVAPLTGDCGTVPLTRDALAVAMARMGFVYLGVDLYPVDMDAADAGQDWDWHGGDPLSSSIGGHCVTLWDYDGLGDGDFVRIATWGALQKATWAWVLNRTREAYALLFPALALEGEDYLGGLDIQGLRAANAAWLAGV